MTEAAQLTRSETTVEGFAEKVLGDYAGANAFLMAGLGDRLGLFAVLAANEPRRRRGPRIGTGGTLLQA